MPPTTRLTRRALRSSLALGLLWCGACAGPQTGGPAVAGPQTPLHVLRATQVRWDKLNAARGDKSPKAATLWGDRHGKVATGFLLSTVDGFKSPPHIHNVSYRAVVLQGRFHNDDPNAEPMWMGPGSFWTQPKGAVHITAAKGQHTLAYVEIESGPYLVRPVDQRFVSGEAPVNVAPLNLVWLDAQSSRWLQASGGAQIAHLWGAPNDGQRHGSFVRLPAGFDGQVRTHGASWQAVVVRGPVVVGTGSLPPGSFVRAAGQSVHRLRCGTQGGCVLYVRAEGRFGVETLAR